MNANYPKLTCDDSKLVGVRGGGGSQVFSLGERRQSEGGNCLGRGVQLMINPVTLSMC